LSLISTTRPAPFVIPTEPQGEWRNPFVFQQKGGGAQTSGKFPPRTAERSNCLILLLNFYRFKFLFYFSFKGDRKEKTLRRQTAGAC